MTTVALIVFTGAQSLDIAGPMDVFAEANRFLLPDEHYQLEIIGIDRAPMRCSNGVVLIADRHWSEVNEPIDLLLVAGGPLKWIAYECGFKNAGRMRLAFLRRLGVTPQQYRQSFGFARWVSETADHRAAAVA